MQNIKSVFVVLKFHNGDWEGVGGGRGGMSRKGKA